MNRESKRDQAKENFWRSAIARQVKSRLTQAEFCLKEGLNANTFCSWKKTIQERDRETGVKGARASKDDAADKPEMSFVPVIVAGSQAARPEEKRRPVAEVRFGGHRVTIFSGADGPTLSALMAACKESFS
ncbi:MAG: hypothetical protein AB7W16_23605 [Candidatus Obscuribacterales bacterium]